MTWRPFSPGAPRAGTANPSRMDNPVWTWLVHTRLCGFRANEALEGPCSTVVGPCWSFRRFGQARVRLPDGTLVCIGGEHEDHDDPDFHIYNDVVVCLSRTAASTCRPIRWTSSSRSIFIRPRWPHEQIVIIGALGYEAQRRHACTPVYSLSLRTFAITRIATTGEGPGWIARHAARLCDGGSAIAIGGGAVMPRADAYPEANLHTWRLDLATWNWTCERRSDWQQCIVLAGGRAPQSPV
ncbi:hypothetical protein LP419_04520 [Massilia sp. H-1]|nr:hypothetical protein LP419_04520 [Massilia sp. H-1]